MTEPGPVQPDDLEQLRPEDLAAASRVAGPYLRRELMSAFGAILTGPNGPATAMTRFREVEADDVDLPQVLRDVDGGLTAESAFFATLRGLSVDGWDEVDVDLVCRLGLDGYPELTFDEMAACRRGLDAGEHGYPFEESVLANQKLADLNEIASNVTVAFDPRKAAAATASINLAAALEAARGAAVVADSTSASHPLWSIPFVMLLSWVGIDMVRDPATIVSALPVAAVGIGLFLGRLTTTAHQRRANSSAAVAATALKGAQDAAHEQPPAAQQRLRAPNSGRRPPPTRTR